MLHNMTSNSYPGITSMRIFLFSSLMLLLACDPQGFGFKQNPAYVLELAFKSVQNLDHLSFAEISSKEALCQYANPTGISYLHQHMAFEKENVRIKSSVLLSQHAKNPEFVGFWSYYKERYQVEVIDRRSGQLLINTLLDCHYGTEGVKDVNLKQLEARKYPKKECRLIKIMPQVFSAPPLSSRCKQLEVQL
jgi:hypothetical protein